MLGFGFVIAAENRGSFSISVIGYSMCLAGSLLAIFCWKAQKYININKILLVIHFVFALTLLGVALWSGPRITIVVGSLLLVFAIMFSWGKLPLK